MSFPCWILEAVTRTWDTRRGDSCNCSQNLCTTDTPGLISFPCPQPCLYRLQFSHGNNAVSCDTTCIHGDGGIHWPRVYLHMTIHIAYCFPPPAAVMTYEACCVIWHVKIYENDATVVIIIWWRHHNQQKDERGGIEKLRPDCFRLWFMSTNI